MKPNCKESMPPKTLLLSFSPLARDPRVLRQAAFLNDEYVVTAAGFLPPSRSYPHFIGIESRPTTVMFKAQQAVRLKLRHFEHYYWAQPHVIDAWNKLKELRFDVIVANDLSSLPLAIRLSEASKARIVLDVHEYEPRHFEGDWFFDFFFRGLWDYVARNYAFGVHAMSTVCQGISRLYREEYGVHSVVLNNAPFRSDLPPSRVVQGTIRIIHHGICNRFRNLEDMIRLMTRLDERFTLDLMLVKTDVRSYSKITRLAARTPRVSVIEPVSYEEIIPKLNEYDLGLCMFAPSTPTLQCALPNKFFEFMQAKLCICTWPSTEIREIVTNTGCGVVSDDFSVESMAAILNRLSSDDIRQKKLRSADAAKEFCAENNKDILLKLVKKSSTDASKTC